MFGDPLVGLLLDLVTAGPHEGSCYTPAVLQVLIGGIDDCIDRLGRQIALDDFDHPENSTGGGVSLLTGCKEE